jgi:catechol 2,3-dioxygenase-like lactoylglutathione lyase family enzyme
MSPSSAKAPHLSRVCFRVRDPGRSAEFYRAIFGLELTRSPTKEGSSAACAQPSSDTRLNCEVVFTEGLPPGDYLTGLDRVSFEVPSRESVDRIYEEARKLNARATQPRLYEGHWQTFIFDPDGYKVEVFTRAQNGLICSFGDQG